jgi:6-phosphogluconolactonase (cycloisomerase 2 family)
MFVSDTQLTAAIPASDLVSPGTAKVTVVTPPVGGGTSNTLLLAVTSNVPRFAYVPNEGTSNVSGYTVDTSSGALMAIASPPIAAGTTPVWVTADPFGRFIYVFNSGSNDVSAYEVDRTTGALSTVAGSPFPAGTGPISGTVDPFGLFLYVANGTSNDLSAYSIDLATGALTPINGSPYALGLTFFSPQSTTNAVALDPSGRFVYVAVNDGTGAAEIVSYTRDINTGVLTPGPVNTEHRVTAVVVQPLGSIALASGSGLTTAFSLDSFLISPTSGALQFTDTFQATFIAGVQVNPTGNFVFVTDGQNVYVLTVDTTSGRLTQVARSPFSVLPGAEVLGVDPSGSFLYGTNSGRNNVTGLKIDPGAGALTPVPGSPFPAGNMPRSIAVSP